MQDKGLWAPFPTLQCLWSALGRMLLCCAVSTLVPCGASLHALISDLDAVYMPEAVRLHTEPSHCAACALLLFFFSHLLEMTKLRSCVNLQTVPSTTGQSAIWSSGLKTAALMACKVIVMHINWEWCGEWNLASRVKFGFCLGADCITDFPFRESWAWQSRSRN